MKDTVLLSLDKSNLNACAIIIVLTLSVLLSACTSTISDGKLLSKTADVLEISQNNLRISSRVSDVGNIHYTIEADNGIAYTCTLGEGEISAMNSTNCRVIRWRKNQP